MVSPTCVFALSLPCVSVSIFLLYRRIQFYWTRIHAHDHILTGSFQRLSLQTSLIGRYWGLGPQHMNCGDTVNPQQGTSCTAETNKWKVWAESRKCVCVYVWGVWWCVWCVCVYLWDVWGAVYEVCTCYVFMCMCVCCVPYVYVYLYSMSSCKHVYLGCVSFVYVSV